MARVGITTPSMVGELGMRLIREGLEAVIEPEVASAVVFDALEWENAADLPGTHEELLQFLRGSVKKAAAVRLADDAVQQAVARAEELLKQTFANVGTPTSNAGATTVRLPMIEGPVRVILLSKSASLGVRLRAALGGERIRLQVCGTVEQLARMKERMQPDVFIMSADGIDGAAPGPLQVFVNDLPKTTTSVVWGSEVPALSKVINALEQSKRPILVMDRRAGVDPLLDVIRSRHAGAAPNG